MEKLIELLNEFENEEADANIRYWNYYQNGFHLLEYGQTYSEMLIISKKYKFIEWLVENEKIDLDKVIDTAKSSVIDTYYYEEGIDDIYIPLLMVLAVEDEPIEYLLSVIK